MMYVWLPFGERLHEHHKVLPSASPDWWERRAATLKQYTLPSLRKQTHTKYQVVAGIPRELKEMAFPVVREIEAFGGIVWEHPIREQWILGQEAEEGFLLSRSGEDFWVVHLDADDMYAPEALKSFAEVSPSEGRTVYLTSGFILDTLTNEAFIYDPGQSPAPFFARFYPKGLTGVSLQKYRECFRYNTHHHQLGGAPNRVRLATTGLYCVTIHSSNTSTARTNNAIASKIRGVVDPTSLRNRFGCVVYSKE